MMDHLSVFMAFVVTFVGFLIHVYAVGYMHHDGSFSRFFAYLNLFIFAMLCLILGDSIIMMFLGWEGVGLCSYLLIGFWYTDINNAKAGKKAFIVNRIGDFGFILGIFTIVYCYQLALGGTSFVVDFKTMSLFFSKIETITFFNGLISAPTLIGLLLFVGAAGKSAQIPLYIWLPDAMAGPTPVSALIHAATMVTAGVYMMCRMSFLYAAAPTALHVIAWIAALTACFAATIAITQNDIKKVLAYSTISQLGYMFAGVASFAFVSGMFHVFTHAFFKALLFLGAGSVIHAVHECQDIRKMGGLRKKLPATYLTFLVATLAISGFPLLSGFFSKDEIIFKTFEAGYYGITVVLMLTAVLTAVYMVRLFVLTFLGEFRGGHELYAKVHESPRIMTIPLMILAFFSLFGGLLGIPHYSAVGHFLEPILINARPMASEAESSSLELVFSIGSGVLALIAILVGYVVYQKNKLPGRLAERFKGIYSLSYHKYYIDELYGVIVITPIRWVSEFFARVTDPKLIDGIANGLGKLSQLISDRIRRMQTGVVQHYITVMVVGMMGILLIVYLKM